MLIIRTSRLNQNMITYCEPQIMSIQVITLSHTCFKLSGMVSDKNILALLIRMNTLTPDSASLASALLSRFAENHELNPSTGIQCCSQIFNSQRV